MKNNIQICFDNRTDTSLLLLKSSMAELLILDSGFTSHPWHLHPWASLVSPTNAKNTTGNVGNVCRKKCSSFRSLKRSM